MAVRVYRGQPASTRDPKGYSANRRQTDAWRRLDTRVRVYNRPLRYYIDADGRERAQEKGVDVALAVDFVMAAAFGEFDTGVLMSGDTDLKPAFEAVFEMGGKPYPRCETACWSADNQPARRFTIPGRKLWCHFLSEDDYLKVMDPTDYTRHL